MIVFMNDPKRTVISLSIPAEDATPFKSLLESYNLSFVSEEKKKGRIILRDISGPILKMSNLLSTIDDAEAGWDGPKNIYILVSSRKKGVKKDEHGSETRREAGEGSEGGNPEGTDQASGHGEADPVGGDCPADRSPADKPAEGHEEEPGTDDYCDQ